MTSSIERALTRYVASELGLVVDREIYRGGIPDGASTGVSVIINNEIVDYQVRVPTYNLQLLGKFSSRDEACDFLANAKKLIPCYGKNFENIKIHSMLARGSGEPYNNGDSGAIKYFASFNLIVVVQELIINKGD